LVSGSSPGREALCADGEMKEYGRGSSALELLRNRDRWTRAMPRVGEGAPAPASRERPPSGGCPTLVEGAYRVRIRTPRTQMQAVATPCRATRR